MTPLLEVQETLYGRFVDRWTVGVGEDLTDWTDLAAALFDTAFVAPVVGDPRTPYALGDEKFGPPNAPWARFSVKAQPGQQGTLGPVGARKFDRVGRVFLQLFHPPSGGEAILSELATFGQRIFEGCRFGPHDIRFGVVDIGESATIEDGRWQSVVVDGRFEFEEQR